MILEMARRLGSSEATHTCLVAPLLVATVVALMVASSASLLPLPGFERFFRGRRLAAVVLLASNSAVRLVRFLHHAVSFWEREVLVAHYSREIKHADPIHAHIRGKNHSGLLAVGER